MDIADGAREILMWGVNEHSSLMVEIYNARNERTRRRKKKHEWYAIETGLTEKREPMLQTPILM